MKMISRAFLSTQNSLDTYTDYGIIHNVAFRSTYYDVKWEIPVNGNKA